MLQKLRSLHEQGRLDTAEASFRRILAEAPSHLHALLGLGHCAQLRGMSNEALPHFAAAFAAHPREVQAALDYGKALRECGRLAEAEEALGGFPDHYDAMMLRGQTMRQLGDSEAALRCFEQAGRLDPKRHQPLTEIITTLRDQRRFAEALAAAETLRAQYPDQAVLAERSIGMTHRLSGNRRAALEAFGRAATLQPEDDSLPVEIATEYQALGQPHEAITLLNQVLARDATHPSATLRLADQHRILGDLEGALALVRDLITHHPKRLDVRLRLAVLLREVNCTQEAEGVLADIETEHGPRPDVAGMRIDWLREDGFLREALAAAQAAFANHPREFHLWQRRFMLALRIAPIDEARRYIEGAPILKPAQAATVESRRLLLAEREGDLARALRHGEEALAQDPVGLPGIDDVVRLRMLTLDLPAARRDLQAYTARQAGRRRLIGQSPNASQSFLGHMYNEFTVDSEALADLVAIRDLAPQARIDALAQAARLRPHHIPTAIMMVMALREAGLFDNAPAPIGTTLDQPAIPRRLAQYWDAPEPPPDLRALHESWKTFNPGYEVRLFSHTAALDYLKAHFPQPVALAYIRSSDPAKRADLFRLAWLWREGGCWADIDDRPTQPLTRLVPTTARAVLWQEPWGTLANNFIGAAPALPMIGWALQTAVAAVNRGDADLLWFSTGPGLITRAFVQALLSAGAERAAWLRNTHVLDNFEPYQAISCHVRASYKKSLNHWTNTAYGGSPRRKPIKATAA